MDPSDLLYTNQFISEKPITIENINRNSENYYNFIKTKRNVNKPIKDYLLNDQLTNQKINKNLKIIGHHIIIINHQFLAQQ